MRWFFAGLLLVNIAFLAWHWQRAGVDVVPAAGRVSSGPASGTGLTLLSELDAMPGQRPAVQTVVPEEPPAPAAEPGEPAEVTAAEPQDEGPAQEPPPAVADTPIAAAMAEPVAEIPKTLCQRLFYLESQADAQVIAKALQKVGGESIREGHEAHNKKRYWVLLPPVSSAATTSATIERLKKAGIKDYYLIRSGESKNAISLGVFSSPDAAQRRIRQIRDLKLKPRMDEINVPTERWWVEFSWPQLRPESEWRTALPKEQRKIEAALCP